MAQSAHKAKVEIQTGGTGPWEELAKATTSNHEKLVNLIEASEYGDDGVRRVAGRVDFTLDVTVNLDLAGESTHRDVFDALRDGSLIGVRFYPSRDNPVHIESICRVASGSTEAAGDGVVAESLSFQNADGNKWTYSTT